MFDWFKGTVTPRDWAAVAIILSASAVLAVLFFFFVYQRQNETITAAGEELADVKKNLAKARETEANIENLRSEALKMDTLVNLFEKRLPTKSEIPALLQNFESVGNDLGLRVQLEALPTVTDVSKETIPYKVTAFGDFHQIVSFINLLERDNRYLKVSDLEMSEQEEGVSAGKFTLSTFRFIQQQPPAAGPVTDEKKS